MPKEIFCQCLSRKRSNTHAYQVSAPCIAWFASWKSEEVYSYREKCPRPFFVHDRHGNVEIHMRTTSTHCMMCWVYTQTQNIYPFTLQLLQGMKLHCSYQAYFKRWISTVVNLYILRQHTSVFFDNTAGH